MALSKQEWSTSVKVLNTIRKKLPKHDPEEIDATVIHEIQALRAEKATSLHGKRR